MTKQTTSVPSQLPPFAQPIIGPDGKMTLAWRRFFESQWNRTGGFDDNIFALLFQNAGASAQILGLQSQLQDALIVIEELRAQVSAFSNGIDVQRQIDELAEQVAVLSTHRVQLEQFGGQIDSINASVFALNQQQQQVSQQILQADLARQQSDAQTNAIAISNASKFFTAKYQIDQEIDLLNNTFNTKVWASLSASNGVLFNGSGAFTADTGTSGHKLPWLDGANTWSALQTMGDLTVTGTLTASITGSATSAAKWTTARTLSFTGDATGSHSVDGSADVATALTLATVNSNVGSFGSGTQVAAFTVNGKGLITAASNVAITSAPKWTTARTLSFTGDATGSCSVDGSADVATALTLATVNSNVGSFGSNAAVPVLTVNAKGLVTAVTTSALGTAAVANTGTSGHTVPFLDGANTWSGFQTFSVPSALPASTVAALPAASSYTNGVAIATDLLSPALTNVAVGGGTARGLVISDGTNWIVG